MNSLIHKYRKDELTPEELSELKKNVGAMTDEEIERQVYASWLTDEVNTSSVDDSTIAKLKSNIDAIVGGRPSRLSLFVRWSQIAAVILLPVFILLAIRFYRENNLIMYEEMFVTTDKTERANITLPDGTTVYLNAESKLGYCPKKYNKNERNVNFSGEGYFQVFHNEDVPFVINANGLQVKVLGTVFNLSVREKNTTAELALEEGCVSLLSTQSNKNVVLLKNQKAILNRLTGDITVISDENITLISAWRRGNMVFHNSELSQVISAIEENYNMTIKVDCKDCLSDQFTGTLPLNNLNEVLEVIEYSYHLKAVISGKEVVMTRNMN
jgi:ferric-dicitrate binding protein FerR (iron transport regulator)